MDDHRFDSLVKSLSNGGSRRGVLQTLGAGTLAAVAARLGLAEDAEAKKKKDKNKNKNKKKCKKGTTKCGKKACCKPGQECTGGVCEDAIQRCQNDADCDAGEVCAEAGTCVIGPECSFSDQCPANEICVAGKCIVCAFPNKPCGDTCCLSNEACVDGQCLVGKGPARPGIASAITTVKTPVTGMTPASARSAMTPTRCAASVASSMTAGTTAPASTTFNANGTSAPAPSASRVAPDANARTRTWAAVPASAQRRPGTRQAHGGRAIARAAARPNRSTGGTRWMTEVSMI